MKSRTAIKIKALSLLIVFSLNTVMGFACSLGIDMGYNSKHHHKRAGTIEQNAGKTEGACHTAGNDVGTSKMQHDKRSNSSNEQDCCSHGVLKFLKLDKNVSPGVTSDIIAPVILLAVYFAYQIDLSLYLKNNANNNYYFIRTHHPPMPDIRIAIHSFLI
jgi:hypothetical protein